MELTQIFEWHGRHIRWARTGSGPDLVFCHGTPWSSRLWAPTPKHSATSSPSTSGTCPATGAQLQVIDHAGHLIHFVTNRQEHTE